MSDKHESMIGIMKLYELRREETMRDARRFPFEIWSRIAQKWHKNPPSELLGYGEPAGYRSLKELIAAYLKSARGVDCDYKQVFITSGAQHALTLAAKIFKVVCLW